MEMKELRALDDGTLKKQLDDLQEEMFKLRFNRAAGQLANFNRLSKLRRDIARVKTLLSERASAMEAKAK